MIGSRIFASTDRNGTVPFEPQRMPIRHGLTIGERRCPGPDSCF